MFEFQELKENGARLTELHKSATNAVLAFFCAAFLAAASPIFATSKNAWSYYKVFEICGAIEH